MATPRRTLMDRQNPADLQDLARGLARANGYHWEVLPLLEALVWVHRAAALADALLDRRIKGAAC
jgi:hypothetical protein